MILQYIFNLCYKYTGGNKLFMKNNLEQYYRFEGVNNSELINSCITNCIYTIFQIEQIDNPIIFFDCSLCFSLKKEADSILGYIYTCQRETLIPEYSECVIEHNNMAGLDYSHCSYEEIWEVHKLNLKNGKPIVLLCDLYYLDYYKNVNKQHRLHGIIAYDIDETNGTIQIIDNGNQFYNGSIGIDEFKRAWMSEYFDNESLMEAELPNNKVWFEVIVDKLEVQDYRELFIHNLEKTKKKFYGNKDDDGILAGLNGLYEVLYRFAACYGSEINIELALKELKDILFEVINRMKLNRLYLTMMLKNMPSQKLNDYICSIENDLVAWNGLYNLVLKGLVVFNEKLFIKLKNKFELCILNEANRRKVLYEIVDSI